MDGIHRAWIRRSNEQAKLIWRCYRVRRYPSFACEHFQSGLTRDLKKKIHELVKSLNIYFSFWFQVGDMISVIDMPPPDESIWWRGKRGFEVGFFPCEYVEVIGDKVPQGLNIAGGECFNRFGAQARTVKNISPLSQTLLISTVPTIQIDYNTISQQ